jgi:uncharacterized membrane protein YjdF
MEATTANTTPQAEAIYQINLILNEEGGGYTFNSPGWDWDEVLADSWSDTSDNPIERVGFKIPSGCEVSFRASTLRTALGLEAK